ncbi:2-aminoethanethiol (cysteamine) dioxygenase b [Electrophorus electricus]|uniref:2-aminoethanethiol (cysteamine) dioxygenase b n=1 Tax=Electrophorus electricus TaxID=8005 RepID=A0A4W4ELX7_ELEEL|nr:2-aminoethanethiol (cysteamine) dioxygenase b [Electrophorus electricus]
MMPRDNMTSLIQKIARQALTTFRNHSATGESKIFLENHSKLRSLLSEVRAADLRIVPRYAERSSAPTPLHGPPVTYMHICETDSFSMGVFLLKHGTCIPLHDHPGMYGMIKVIYGKVRISCFDRLGASPDGALQKSSMRPSTRRSVGEYTEEDAPCVLSPYRDNIHQLEAVDGPTAFLDILAPPYDPDGGRDCHYYKVLQPASESAENKAEVPGHAEVWLAEIPQPGGFWCGSEPYPGPKVSL